MDMNTEPGNLAVGAGDGVGLGYGLEKYAVVVAIIAVMEAIARL